MLYKVDTSKLIIINKIYLNVSWLSYCLKISFGSSHGLVSLNNTSSFGLPYGVTAIKQDEREYEMINFI